MGNDSREAHLAVESLASRVVCRIILGSFGTLGGVIRSRVTHAVCWYCASPPTPKGETAGVALFFGVFMAIYLPMEAETVVAGDGAGFISIRQTPPDGIEVVVWLSVHQFREIWNREKSLIAEAYEEEDAT